MMTLCESEKVHTKFKLVHPVLFLKIINYVVYNHCSLRKKSSNK